MPIAQPAPQGAFFTFACPVCGKTFTYEGSAEPCCTGPSETRNDHAMTVMRLLKIERRNVDPVRAEARRHGPLILAT
jgi:hypothetical protein